MKFNLLFTLVIAAICVVFSCTDLEKPDAPITIKPVADFKIKNTDFTAPVDVTVENTSTNTTSNTTYEWDFGNGQTSNEKNPPPSPYLLMNNYKIKLTVKDGANSDTKELMISVVDPKQPVRACFEYNANNNGAAPSLVTFDASCSQNGKIYNWDFGDPTSSSNSGVGIEQSHLYSKVGIYKAKLTVINGAESKDTTININILNPPPKPCLSNISATNNYVIPSTVTFDASCSQNVTSYDWDFGDPGSGAQNKATGATTTHTYTTNGNFNVKLALNGLGGSKDTSFIVTIKGPAPVSSFVITNNNCVGPCTVTFTNNSQNATSYIWEFGDGKTSMSTATTVTNTYNLPGTYPVKLTATGAGGTVASSQSVVIGNGNKSTKLDVSSISITPLHGVQRSDGKYHIIYKTSSSGGTLYSVIIDKEFKAASSLSILGSFNHNSIAPLNDGSFLISAPNTADNKFGRLIKISSSQLPLSFDKSIDFNDGVANTTSFAYAVSNLDKEEFILSGFYINATKKPTSAPAINTFSKSGTSLLKKRVESTDVENIYITRLAQTSSGNNLIGLGNTYWCNNCTPKRLLVILTSGGNFSKKVDLGTAVFNDIVRIGTTNNFLLRGSNKIRAIKEDGTQIWEKTVVELSEKGAILNNAINNATSLSDGSILVCGNKSNTAYLAKYKDNGELSWEKSYTQKAGSGQTIISYASSVTSTSDGGFLITGGTYIAGVNDTDLYLIKTDKDGNIQ